MTPSSKVVGDLAQFMVANNLDEHSLVDKAESLNLPSSVIEFLQGSIGHPIGGFPEPLTSRVLKDLPRVIGRPGESLPPVDLKRFEVELKETHETQVISQKDVLSAALYPKVFDEYIEFVDKYSRFVEKLPTRAFLAPLDVDEEIDVELSQGNIVNIKYKAKGELQPNGTREVFFEANGVLRSVEVKDEIAAKEAGMSGSSKKAPKEKADPRNPGSVAAPMSGEVVEVRAKPGMIVKSGEQLVVLSAMKMETSVAAPCSGMVQHVYVIKGDQVDNADALFLIKPEKPDGGYSSSEEDDLSQAASKELIKQ